MKVSVSGRNFGTFGADNLWLPAERVVSVNVSGIECAAPTRLIVQGMQQVQCDLPPSAVVGYKDIELLIAGQGTALSAADPRSLLVVCDAGQFGHTGETCATCPVGARCLGYLANFGADLRTAAALNASGGTSVWQGNTEVSSL